MRIAALVATEAVSGPGRQLAALRAPLLAEGVDLEVLLLHRQTDRRPPYADYLARAGVPYHLIRDRGPFDWRMVNDVRRTLDAIDAMAIQTHGYKATALGFALRYSPRRRTRRPWIGFYHGATDKGIKDRSYQWLELRLLRSAEKVVVISRQQARLFKGFDRVTQISNAAISGGRPKGRVSPEAHPGLRNLSRPVVGVVGRLSHEKGVDVFLHACVELERLGRTFSAVIVGDGPEEAALNELASKLGLTDRVRFVGRVEAVDEIYAGLDLLVLPSRSEGLPNVLLEGLEAAVPVVATAVGAVPEVLTHPAVGVMTRPEDPEQLAEAMEAALQQCRGAAAAEARTEILARFSLSQRVRDHLDLYTDLVEAERRDSRRQ